MPTLVIAEHDQHELKDSTLATLSAANFLKNPIHIFVAGHNCQNVVEQASKFENVIKVIYVNKKELVYPIAENIVPTLFTIADHYQHILAPATTFGKNLLPCLAALLDVEQISDVISIQSQTTFVRPIYAGNVIITVESLDPIKVLTIRPAAFPKTSIGNRSAEIKEIDWVVPSTPSPTFIKLEAPVSSLPELSSARIVVAGGRGLQSKKNFELIKQLAEVLGAAIGASRAAVDAGFISNDFQVGQTGKIVAPDLYFAIGISGAIQHLAGIMGSKIIVSINKDPEAPIFEVSDYGIVGDLFDILPKLVQNLKRLKVTS